jgi:hypothetical protein
MDTGMYKSFIINNIDNLDYKEKKDVLTMFLAKYGSIINDKPIGSIVDLNKIDSDTLSNIYNYMRECIDQKLNQFKN